MDELADIEEIIAASRTVVIEFGAAWCAPCRAFLPQFENFAEKNPDITCVKVDIDVDAMVVSHYNIMAVPQVWLFRNGHKAGELQSRTKPRLEKEITSILEV